MPLNTDPEAFLIPGVCGDEPRLADLRRCLIGRIHLRLLELPGITCSSKMLTSMKATAIAMSSEILRQTANECVSLVGYSFGASVALEVANHLSAVGRKVVFLVIVDGPFRTDELQGRLSFLRKASRPHAITRKAVELVSVSVDVTRRLAWAAAEPSCVGNDQSAPIRRALLAHLRGKALDAWTPQSCHAKGILLRTEEFGELNRERWLSLCPNLRCVTLPGKHEDLLAGSSFTTVAAALAEVIPGANAACNC